MIKQKNIVRIVMSALLCSLLISSFLVHGETLDRIIAVVENDVILEGELEREVNTVRVRMTESKAQLPPETVLRKQVLEKMIMDKLQRQLAEKAGVNISEEMLNSSAADIAQRNNMSLEQFRSELEASGISYQAFLENMRNEIVISQLRAKEIGGRIKVSDSEVEHYMGTEGAASGTEATQYHLGHILIAVKEGASSSEIQKAQIRATTLVKKLRAGQDFSQAAISESEDSNALNGGDLGWRTINDIPTQLVDGIKQMHLNDVSDPIRSSSGFHIIKMLGLKSDIDDHVVSVTKVRHILIKTNELVDDAEARKRLFALKARIADGDDFTSLARSHSDDKGSALNGGDLGWVEPGSLVKPFEDAMAKLKINELSDPVQSQFGWHLIQVLGRKDKDNASENKKNAVREAIRKRKIEEETELWLRRLRDEAYVEIK
jgi:peptidyl-prolyl cis-trans isomerase SurA